MTKTVSDDGVTAPALPIFALGHVDASLSFFKLLPDVAREEVATALAYRLLSKLWTQYRIDCGINQGRTLLGTDNGYELRVFTALVDDVCEWVPMRSANGKVRAHSPALSAYERQLYERDVDEKRPLLLEVCAQIGRLTTDLDPARRAALLIDRCQKLDELSDYGICWALNLVSAFRLNPLGASKASVPFPALFRREFLRFDRSKTWRDGALRFALAESAHEVSAAVFDGFHSKAAFDRLFPRLRSNSRLSLAHVYLSGIGELPPALLGRLVGCSEPGARKMLKQLMAAGFARHHTASPVFERAEGFRLGWSSAPWLRSFSMVTATAPEDLFDE